MPGFTEQELQKIIDHRAETANVDFKLSLDWSQKSDERLEIVKDMLAMANTRDGGMLIFGVSDAGDKVGVPPEHLKSFDQTSFNDFLHKYTDPRFSAHLSFPKVDGTQLVVVEVPEFSEDPILCKDNAGSSKDSKKMILQGGALYIRTEKAQSVEVPTSTEMRELLGRAIGRKGDTLLNSIQRLLKGRPAQAEEDTDQFEKEVDDADKYGREKLGGDIEKRGHWELRVQPAAYQKEMVADLATLRPAIEKQQVRLRGWYFPHLDRKDFSNFSRGVQSWTRFEPRHLEMFRIYTSGLMVYKQTLWEDGEDKKSEDGRPSLSFISAIYTITEHLLFIKRFYCDELKYDGDLQISLTLHGSKNRELATFDFSVALHPGHVCQDEIVELERKVTSEELRSSWKEIANDLSLRLFRVFNWNEIRFDGIEHWQNKLITKNL